MRCVWCGGEIVRPFVYDLSQAQNSFQQSMKNAMRGKFYCSPACLRQATRCCSRDFLQPRAARQS